MTNAVDPEVPTSGGLDEFTRSRHNITTSGRIAASNGEAIIANFEKSKELVKKLVLPELYKSYWFLEDPNKPSGYGVLRGLKKPPERNVEYAEREARIVYSQYDLVNSFNYIYTVQALVKAIPLNHGTANNHHIRFFSKNWWSSGR